ncbi:6013_t:CDS:10 [Dentiscutata erythropus]|uniref:6013_t:CDS:1 n=1 Tax=Dentiscutata erythropus TaxID=1348616 RepID=A0A9N9J0C7_9GLOM|nr:6013_t:CDS:10 [Dentiscutata erythropus]
MLKEQLIFFIKNLGRHEQINGLLDKSTQYYRIGADCKASLEGILTLIKGLNSVNMLVYLWELHLLEKHLLTIFLLNNNIKDNDTKSIIVTMIELFVLMTTPVVIDQNVDFADDNACLQRDILKAQIGYKELFTKNPVVLRTLLNLLNDHLKIEISEPTESNIMVVRLVLALFRNLLAIDKKDKRLHYNLVHQYYKETILECLCSFDSNTIELFQCNIIIQEIFYHIFYGIEPSEILENPTAVSNEFSKKLLENEEKKKEDYRRRFNERFGGKYWVKMPDGYEVLTSKRNALSEKLPNNSEDKENKRPIKDEWLPKKKPGLDINNNARQISALAVTIIYVIYTKYCSCLLPSIAVMARASNWAGVLETNGNLLSRTIETMGSKNSNEDHETCNKVQQLQYRILCDKENLELIVDVVKRSSKQSHNSKSPFVIDYLISFLRNLIETVHRLLSMLERVKLRKYIYVKQKRHTNKLSKKVKYTKDEYEYRMDKIDSREQRHRADAFDRYEKCYVDEEVLSTYCALLDKEYETIDLDFHYINTMFFRIFSNCESSFFLKLSFMELLHRILEHFRGLTDSFHLNLNESQIKFKEFAYKIVEDFAIRMEKNPLTYIELIFPKTDLGQLEFKEQEEPSHEAQVEQFIENLLKLLLEEGKSHLIEWLQEVLRKFAEENQAYDSSKKHANNAEQLDALTHDEHFMAFLGVLEFRKIGDEDNVRWITESADLFSLINKIETKLQIIEIRKMQEKVERGLKRKREEEE